MPMVFLPWAPTCAAFARPAIHLEFVHCTDVGVLQSAWGRDFFTAYVRAVMEKGLLMTEQLGDFHNPEGSVHSRASNEHQISAMQVPAPKSVSTSSHGFEGHINLHVSRGQG